MSEFVVTTSIRGATKTQVWESSKPLALGQPFRWVLERSEHGVRLRDLRGGIDHIETERVRELTDEEIRAGAEIEIAPYQLRIRPVRKLAPAFEAGSEGPALVAYACIGNWVVGSESVTGNYVARAAGVKIFELRESQAGYSLRASAEIKLGEKILPAGESQEFTREALTASTLSYAPTGAASTLLWRFSPAGLPQFVDSPGRASAIELEDQRALKKAARATAIGFVALLALSLLWPAPKDNQELVPEQFAKIVFTPQPKPTSAPASTDTGAPSFAKNAPKKVQDAAVVQAFRAKALASAVNGLLKGGMTRLLAQSDFVSGSSRSAEARRLFDAKNTELLATAPLGTLGRRHVEVASLGGDALGVAGSDVGYGKGERAAVKGQGQGFATFVSADTKGASVDEGLTKDEVGEVIHRHLSEIRYCYESAMIRSPDIEGKLVADFTINGLGVVRTAEAKSSTLPDPRLDDCIIRRLLTWQFPKPRGGVDVSVTYPFIFKTLGR